MFYNVIWYAYTENVINKDSQSEVIHKFGNWLDR